MEYDRTAMTEAARELQGTPWKWRGWQPGKAVDCLFSTFYILKAGGVVPDTLGGQNYYDPKTGAKDDTCVALKFIETILHVEQTEPQPGAIAIFKNGAMTSHLGVITDEGLSHIIYGRTFATEPVDQWASHILGFYTPTKPGYKKCPFSVSIPELSTKQ